MILTVKPLMIRQFGRVGHCTRIYGSLSDEMLGKGLFNKKNFAELLIPSGRLQSFLNTEGFALI